MSFEKMMMFILNVMAQNWLPNDEKDVIKKRSGRSKKE